MQVTKLSVSDSLDDLMKTLDNIGMKVSEVELEYDRLKESENKEIEEVRKTMKSAGNGNGVTTNRG